MDKIKKNKALLQTTGGGNGTRGTDTNEGTMETKGDKKTRGKSTNAYVKDFHHSHKKPNE